MQASLRRLLFATPLFMAALLATPAHAQSSASGSMAVNALVVNPLALNVTRPLDFGRLLTSSSRTIAPSAATSGRFELVGEGGSAVTVTLAMPSQLTPTAGADLPVGAWTFVASNSPALGGAPVSFNAGATDNLAISFQSATGTTKIYFGIGATVTVSAAQPSSTYTATGQITAAYADL
ncbi:MAG: DUF4402 domain-containing protein [Gemmatimonadaceae bacterium]